MGRPPRGFGPTFRFTPNEVMEMESCLQEISKFNHSVPPRETIRVFAEKFSASKDRAGKVVVQPRQVLNWFQNRRYARRIKVKEPAKLSIPPVPRDVSAQFRNVTPVSVLQVQSMDKSTSKFEGRDKRSYMHWTTEMDTTLSNVLLEQHSLGHKTPNGWKGVAFTAAIIALKEICNVDTSKEMVMARLKTWNKYYKEVGAMLNTSGFGWDCERNMLKVDNEEVWTNYTKANSSVKHYKDKMIVNWSDLSVLCGKDKAIGGHAKTAIETINEIDVESIAEDSNSTHERPELDSEGSTRSMKKRVVGGVDAVVAAINNLAKSLHQVVETNPTSSRLRSSSNVDNIYAALAQIPDLDEHELLKAMDLLSYDNIKHAIFMTLPNQMKSEWLRMQFEK